MKHSCNDFDRGNPKYWEIKLRQCHFNVHHKIHMDWTGTEPRTLSNMMSNDVDKLNVCPILNVRLSGSQQFSDVNCKMALIWKINLKENFISTENFF